MCVGCADVEPTLCLCAYAALRVLGRELSDLVCALLTLRPRSLSHRPVGGVTSWLRADARTGSARARDGPKSAASSF